MIVSSPGIQSVAVQYLDRLKWISRHQYEVLLLLPHSMHEILSDCSKTVSEFLGDSLYFQYNTEANWTLSIQQVHFWPSSPSESARVQKIFGPDPEIFCPGPVWSGGISKFYPARFWTVHDHDRFFQRLWSILGYSIKSTNFVELAVCKFFVISLGCLARNVVKRFLSPFSVTSIAKCGKDRHHF